MQAQLIDYQQLHDQDDSVAQALQPKVQAKTDASKRKHEPKRTDATITHPTPPIRPSHHTQHGSENELSSDDALPSDDDVPQDSDIDSDEHTTHTTAASKRPSKAVESAKRRKVEDVSDDDETPAHLSLQGIECVAWCDA